MIEQNPPSPLSDALLAVFLRKRVYEVNESGCHVWQGQRNWTNYGQVWYKGKNYLAHRLAWQSVNGSIPPGMMVMHKCDNPPCINPDHLMLGTAADNARDMVQKGRSTRGRAMPHRKYRQAPDATQQYALEGREYTEDTVRKLRAKARAREYQRQRRATDPAFRAKQDAATRRWQTQNPERWHELQRASEERQRDVVDPDWRMKRYERILQRRENTQHQAARVALKEQTYSQTEIAHMVGVTQQAVSKWIRRGKLPAIKFDGKGQPRVTLEALSKFLESRRGTSISPSDI